MKKSNVLQLIQLKTAKKADASTVKTTDVLKRISQAAEDQARTGTLIPGIANQDVISRSFEARWKAAAELAECIQQPHLDVYSAFMTAADLARLRNEAVEASHRDGLNSQPVLRSICETLEPKIETGLRFDM